MFLALLLLASAAIVPLIAPVKKVETLGVTLRQQLKGLGVIVGTEVFWRAAPLMMMVLGTFAALTQLWAGPWVRDVAGLSRTEAANLLLVLAGAMTASGLLTGGLVAMAKRYGLTPMGFVAAMAGLFAIVLVVLFLQWIPSLLMVLVIWALFGFIASLNFVTYAALGPQFPQQFTGILNACLTLSWMLGAFLIQNIYGFILDQFPATNGGYSVEGHRVATGILIVFLLMTLGWFFASPRIIKTPGRIL